MNKSWRKWDSKLGPSALEANTLPLGQRGGQTQYQTAILAITNSLMNSKKAYTAQRLKAK